MDRDVVQHRHGAASYSCSSLQSAEMSSSASREMAMSSS